jgi:hypothetical protein
MGFGMRWDGFFYIFTSDNWQIERAYLVSIPFWLSSSSSCSRYLSCENDASTLIRLVLLMRKAEEGEGREGKGIWTRGR